ncbi:MAG: hypothetical protein WCF85_11020 [Rhodospirillaceae bacterium]
MAIDSPSLSVLRVDVARYAGLFHNTPLLASSPAGQPSTDRPTADVPQVLRSMTEAEKLSRAARSKVAANRLQQLINQAKLLRLMSTVDAKANARHAADLARQIAAAVKDYEAGAKAASVMPAAPSADAEAGAGSKALKTEANAASAEATSAAVSGTPATAGNTADEKSLFGQVRATLASLRGVTEHALRVARRKHKPADVNQSEQELSEIKKANQQAEAALHEVEDHGGGESSAGGPSQVSATASLNIMA